VELGVIGAGYVGLTTAACFAHLGHRVVCADIDAAHVERLSAGDVGIAEPGLTELVVSGLESGRLRFVTEPVAAVDADIVFICVGTPPDSDGAADLSAIKSVVRTIAPVLRRDAVLVTKSTVPVGSAQMVNSLIPERDDIAVVSNPEFLREGHAVDDFLEPSRVVVGGDIPAARARVADLYTDLQAPVLVTDPASAELVKYATNAFLATKISFANAIANVCEAVGADIRQVGLGMGHDPRIGFDHLEAGPGFGGSCLPKDVSALLHFAREAGYDFALLRGVLEVNDEQRARVVTKVRALAGGDLGGVSIGVLGLAFKAGTDDLRDSPALAVVASLVAEGAAVKAFDPAVDAVDLPISVVKDPYEAARDAAVLVVLTEWAEFRSVDYERVATEMKHAVVVDARNLLNPDTMRRQGFEYVGVGR